MTFNTKQGRKPIFDQAMTRVVVSLTPTMHGYFKDLGKGNVSAGVRIAAGLLSGALRPQGVQRQAGQDKLIDVKTDQPIPANATFQIEAMSDGQYRAAVVPEKPTYPDEFAGNDADHNKPVPMVLRCSYCGKQHIDKDEWATHPHKTHLCEFCGHRWRVTMYGRPTVGVEAQFGTTVVVVPGDAEYLKHGSFLDKGECESCVNGKCVTGDKCVTLGRDS